MAVFRPTLWRWISVILGVMCLLLMATLGLVLISFFPKPSIEPTVFPRSTLEIQEDLESFSCQERWVGYQCSCYFISRDTKTWKESINFCASQNSTLLQIHNRDELHFMKLNSQFYWIGVTHSTENGVWQNGSSIAQDLFPFSQTANQIDCRVYNPRGVILHESCGKENLYICKKQLI